MLLSIPARNNGQTRRFSQHEMDTLRGGAETVENTELIAVTDGLPGSTIRRAYNFTRPRKSVQRLIDDGYLTFVRHETYARGASCDVYKLSASGKAAVETFYDDVQTRYSKPADDGTNQRIAWRLICRAELEKQFGPKLYLPSIFAEISDSNCPFIDSPLPSFAPNTRDGQPVTIREYMMILWSRLLSEKGAKILSDFCTWGGVIGFENAADMLHENSNFSAADLFGGGFMDADE